MEESLGLGKKSYGTETDTETWSWFRLPIPKPGLGCTLIDPIPIRGVDYAPLHWLVPNWFENLPLVLEHHWNPSLGFGLSPKPQNKLKLAYSTNPPEAFWWRKNMGPNLAQILIYGRWKF